MSDHISKAYDQELDQLRRLVSEMGGSPRRCWPTPRRR